MTPPTQAVSRTPRAAEAEANAGQFASPQQRPLRVVDIIAGLGTGGAETVLFRLLEHRDRRAMEPSVISTTEQGTYGGRIEALGVPVHALGSRRSPGLSWTLAALRSSLVVDPDLLRFA